MDVLDLVDAAQKLADWADHPAVAVDAMRCTHTRNKSSGCQVCVSGCPASAITLEKHQVVVDTTRCAQCGFCLRACPTGAFTGFDASERLVDAVKSLQPGRTLEIACPHHPQPDTRLRVSQSKIIAARCLAAFGLSTYARLMALGVGQVLLRLEACADCPIASHEMLEMAAQANALLASDTNFVVPIREVGENDLRLTSAQPSSGKRVSRRDLFQMFRKPLDEPVVVPAADAALPDPFNESLPHERAQLVQALRQLASGGAATPFADLKVEGACTACGVCASACPTNALQLACGEQEFALNYAPGACTQCALCIELCPAGILAFGDPVAVEQAVTMECETITSGALRYCRRCGAPFAASERADLCPTCAFRQRNPFGSAVLRGENHG